MNLKKIKSDQKKIWRYLAKHSDPKKSASQNKRNAAYNFGIITNDIFFGCLYCEYSDVDYDLSMDIDIETCKKCPTPIKHGETCLTLGILRYQRKCTPENARIFYENAIKGT